LLIDFDQFTTVLVEKNREALKKEVLEYFKQMLNDKPIEETNYTWSYKDPPMIYIDDRP
jgi:hypothetical protein